MRDFSLHLMDIIQNSVSAEAKRIEIKITADREQDKLQMVITDNGAGMNEELLSSITNPFVTTRKTRKIGLGIPLLKASVERASGSMSIKSVEAEGTTLEAGCRISHIDRPPIGDVAETLVTAISANSGIDMQLKLKHDSRYFEMDTHEIRQKLGDVPINNYEVLAWIKEFINEGLKSTFGGVLDEVNS